MIKQLLTAASALGLAVFSGTAIAETPELDADIVKACSVNNGDSVELNLDCVKFHQETAPNSESTATIDPNNPIIEKALRDAETATEQAVEGESPLQTLVRQNLYKLK
tara:strand:- start:584 stop:907 length:324 start_codon:yes stop_codon:yes gene_type:complete